MKHLRQCIRQILLTEAAKTYHDIPDKYWIGMRESNGEWARWDIMKGPKTHFAWDKVIDTGPVRGYIEIGRVFKNRYGNCLDAWMVKGSRAGEGFGPMLYDLAVEYATVAGSGLISDRGTVSNEARPVWEFYLENRNDVEKVQLDNLFDSFNNGPEDDCDQGVTSYDRSGETKPWNESALSKMYIAKSSGKIRELESIGKLAKISKPKYR